MFLHTSYRAIDELQVKAPGIPGAESILTPEALEFVAALETEFGSQRRALLKQRRVQQAELDAGALPDFLTATRGIRESAWRAAPIPHDLLDRRVEITGPPERKMLINALNSGANIYMADFEDALSPSWSNLLLGQKNLCDAVDGSISYTSPDGKQYRLADRVATLMVRPRGWHLDEKHVVIDKRPISASLFDFGLFFFHNARKLLEKGTGPYFYLPKLEHHTEAQLWNDVFVMAQEMLGIPRGTIRATVLIETILAAFEMEEILYALREHSAGLNCGRWDYIFSVIKKFRNRPEFIFPDRNSVTMTAHFLRSYSRLLIQTCHRRGAHAIGGMAAYIPVKNDSEANERAIQKVRADKEREVSDGHDGTWVAHPGLVPIAKAVFDAHMLGPNQVHEMREDVHVTAGDLLTVPEGVITEEGVRTNIRIALQYIEAWLGGNGCVPLNNLMEDTATAEISRAQLWQWLHHPNVALADGRPICEEDYRRLLHEEISTILAKRGAGQNGSQKLATAKAMLNRLALKKHFEEFLTQRAYRYLE